jgi:hypothetical protein
MAFVVLKRLSTNMSKRKKSGKVKNRKRRNTSSLQQHSRIGKTLLPPFLTLPGSGLTPISWMNDRLPEMLWACLVISVIPRHMALDLFREIAAIGFKFRDNEASAEWGLTHSHLAELPEEILTQVIQIVTRHPLGYACLRPLLLLDKLPGKERWKLLLQTDPQEDDWSTLGNAVLVTLDHQSQESTDVRWLRILFMIALGRIHFPHTMKERIEEIVHYPNRGDMRSVRPSIRAMEIGFASSGGAKNAQTAWASDFWSECFFRTACVPAENPRSIGNEHKIKESIGALQVTHRHLIDHWFATVSTTGIDARHDAAFGFCFYGIAVLLEMLVGRNAFGIIGRVLLRTLAEVRITLAYLREKDSQELWVKFRAFGVGQAKLALLKLDDIHNQPKFANPDVLEQLSNEDYFQEFVPIDLGHWCGIDLRKMAEASNTKSDYDRFYGWSSSFVHGHWSALRDASMMHCFNPLHRLHRIPLPSHRMLESAAWDGAELVNAMLSDLSSLYPTFESRTKLVPV